jgi:hypothetical protein
VPDAPGVRPILFRTRAVVARLDPSAPDPELPPRMTVVGWQRTVGRGRGKSARNMQTLLALYDDGSMILTDDRAALG